MMYIYKKIAIYLTMLSLLTGILEATSFTAYEVKYTGFLSHRFLQDIKNNFNVEIFIETGTAGGGSTQRIADVFPMVHTVEMAPLLYDRASRTLKQRKNVKMHLGESTAVLKGLLPILPSSAAIAFFLDAHYSGSGTACGIDNTPLAREIALIGSYYKDAIILIDDLRLCQSNTAVIEKQILSDPEEKTIFGYPTLTDIKNLLLSINPSYNFVIWGDMGFAYPQDKYPNVCVSEVIKAMTISRLFDETSQHTSDDIIEILGAEKTIMCAHGDEVLNIKELLNPANGYCRPSLFAMHYTLWNLLLCIREKDYQRGQMLVEELEKLGFPYWRLEWYKALFYMNNGKREEASRIIHMLNEKELLPIKGSLSLLSLIYLIE